MTQVYGSSLRDTQPGGGETVAQGHTAGPWVARKAHSGIWDVFDPQNRDVVTVSGGGVWPVANEANARLIAAAPEGLAFAMAAGGEDGFLLAQIATFIGGWADAARLKGKEKEVAEAYYEALHALSEQGRAFIAKATRVADSASGSHGGDEGEAGVDQKSSSPSMKEGTQP